MKAILDRLFQHKVIVNCDRDPYLFRWYVFRTKRVALFIHKFIRSDEDRALHDHPWGFLVIPVWRGYIEHSQGACSICSSSRYEEGYDCPRWLDSRIPRSRRVWPIIGTRLRSATYRHRVELIDGKPSWSIFFRFQEWRTWGFWLPEGFVAWNKWWQDKCE